VPAAPVQLPPAPALAGDCPMSSRFPARPAGLGAQPPWRLLVVIPVAAGSTAGRRAERDVDVKGNVVRAGVSPAPLASLPLPPGGEVRGGGVAGCSGDGSCSCIEQQLQRIETLGVVAVMECGKRGRVRGRGCGL